MEEDESSECRRRQSVGKVEGRGEGGGAMIGRRTEGGGRDGKNRERRGYRGRGGGVLVIDFIF